MGTGTMWFLMIITSWAEGITVAASNVTIADLTIKRARTHAIHVVSSSSADTVNTLIYNARGVGFGMRETGSGRTYDDGPCPDASGYVGHYHGDVDHDDLGVLAALFGKAPSTQDIDGDADMDGADLYGMAISFNSCDCMP